MQFCLHFPEACKIPSSYLNDNEIRLSRLLYHVAAMSNTKLNGTQRQHCTDPYTHITLSSPDTIYH